MSGAAAHTLEGAASSDWMGEPETPVGVIDVPRVRANARRAASYCREHGIAWRPHVKTHKCLEVARIQLEEGAAGLTVATPREAEVMSTVCDDLVLAYPPLGRSKVGRLVRLAEHVRLGVGLDSAEALRPLAAAAADQGRTIEILVELDAGLGRVGVAEPSDALALAELVRDLPGVAFRGLMFYPGHLRVSAEALEAGLGELNGRITDFLDAFERGGIPVGVVSGGSTPTLWESHRIEGLTEVRPGTCIYNDRDIVSLGACGVDDLAYSVLATVVSTVVSGQAVVDAGSKALAKEHIRSDGTGFGCLLDRPEVAVKALSEEHGVLDLTGVDWRPAVGDRVRIVPNHVCVSVNLQDHVVAVDADGARRWPLDARGRGPYDSPRRRP